MYSYHKGRGDGGGGGDFWCLSGLKQIYVTTSKHKWQSSRRSQRVKTEAEDEGGEWGRKWPANTHWHRLARQKTGSHRQTDRQTDSPWQADRQTDRHRAISDWVYQKKPTTTCKGDTGISMYVMRSRSQIQHWQQPAVIRMRTAPTVSDCVCGEGTN